MDIKIIAVTVAGTHPIPIENAIVRFYHLSTEEIIDLAKQGKSIEVTLLYNGVGQGSSAEQRKNLQASIEDIWDGGKKVVVLNSNDPGNKNGGIFFTEIAYNF